MTQAIFNGRIELVADTWTKISEVNCTFQALSDEVEVIGTDGETPGTSDRGMICPYGAGEDVSFDTLSRFVGAGAEPDGLWAISRGEDGAIFVSREAVA